MTENPDNPVLVPHPRRGRLQVVRWGRYIGFGWIGPYPYEGSAPGCIYRWRYALGWVEIRRWA